MFVFVLFFRERGSVSLSVCILSFLLKFVGFFGFIFK